MNQKVVICLYRLLCYSSTMGNTTSERVSGERHGSKSHRSDGASSTHHAKDTPNKIMVGSTDDPNIFSTHESKVQSKNLRDGLPV